MRWKHLFPVLVLLVTAGLFHSGTGYAASNNDTGKLEKGILWSITTPGTKPSYLFGTIHLDDARVTELPKVIDQAFKDSESFVMEVVVDPDSLARMSGRLFLPPEETLEQILGKKLFDETKQAVKAHGLSPQGLNQLKPWVVITMLSTPKPKSGIFLDLKLHLQAIGLKKPVHGLESMAEQIDVFDTLLLKDQISLLKETLATRRIFNLQIETLIQAYLARDLEKIQQAAGAMAPKTDVGAYRRLMDRLLDKRNIRMAERLGPLLKKGSVFVAVGVLHLPGEQGLIKLLKDKGYQLKPIY